MRRCLLVWSVAVGVMVGGPAPMAAQEPPAQGQPTFRSGVDVVSVGATVRDRRGRLVSGLTAGDFVVLDGGQPRDITGFESERVPVSLAILFDISGSMDIGDRTTAARFAAHHVISWLEQGRDEAALFAFDSRLHEVAPFTVDTRALQGALGEVDPFGATSLHDAIEAAARRVAERTGRRRAVVVLTDAIDTASRLSPAEVSGIASAIDVPVYVIATVMAIDNPSLNGSVDRSITPTATGTVEDLALWTGGAFFHATTPSETSRVARQVIEELRHQYLIAFEPATGSGWRPLEIRTRQKDYTVRARSGYMAGGARPAIGW
jgi:Ca-activated chloride channel homolog